MDNYINERAKEEGRDPRDELVEFVCGNVKHLRKNFFENVAPDLDANNDEQKLREYVLTNNPYEVLDKCFTSHTLGHLAIDQLDIELTSEVKARDLIGKMLEDIGFIQEVKPDGLSQIRKKLEPSLNQAAGNVQLDMNRIDGTLAEMAREMEDILIRLFLFHSQGLKKKLLKQDNTDSEKLEELENLINKFNDEKKQMGDYVKFLYLLMEMFGNNELPLKGYQIAEINLFKVYRNLTLKNPDSHFWVTNKSFAEQGIEVIKIALENAKQTLSEQNDAHTETYLEKLENTYNEWNASWQAVTTAWDQKVTFPKRNMLQRMASFFLNFLNLLSEDKIYPKVIVMQYYKIDNYGTYKIYAIDDAEKKVCFTDEEFIPFVEYYYQSHTNPTGIDPILVLKEELEDKATPLKKNTENQEEV